MGKRPVGPSGELRVKSFWVCEGGEEGIEVFQAVDDDKGGAEEHHGVDL